MASDGWISCSERLPDENADAALAIGMNTEFMRINQEIDRLICECNSRSGYGRAQQRALQKLKERIKW